jgi:hypothetical protein
MLGRTVSDAIVVTFETLLPHPKRERRARIAAMFTRTRTMPSRFARAFPIVAARRQLTWAHYRILNELDDES